MSDYDHAGTWTCSHCGTEFEVERKADVLVFALGHRCDDTGEVDG